MGVPTTFGSDCRSLQLLAGKSEFYKNIPSRFKMCNRGCRERFEGNRIVNLTLKYLFINELKNHFYSIFGKYTLPLPLPTNKPPDSKGSPRRLCFTLVLLNLRGINKEEMY